MLQSGGGKYRLKERKKCEIPLVSDKSPECLVISAVHELDYERETCDLCGLLTSNVGV